MDLITITLDVLKLYKFNEIKDEQLQNILLNVITLDVLKLDKFNEIKDAHLLNILCILVT